MSNFHVTVLIATYNRAEYIAESIDSVFAQTLSPMQIIVVNDGCTDSTEEVLARYGDRIEVYRQDNDGKPSAINFAMPHVRGDCLWIFDDDDVALPDAIENYARAFREHPDVDFVYSSFNDVRTNSDGSFRIITPYVIPDIASEQVFVELLFGNFLKGGAPIMAKTACYREVGPFDETLVRSEDYEMLLRLSRCYHSVGIKEPTYLRRLHDGRFGDAVESVSFEEKHITFLKYDRKIANRLYKTLEAKEYVPERRAKDGLDPPEERLFRIRRSAMMAINGLWEPAFADLEAFIALFLSGGAPTLAAEEIHCLRRMVRPRYVHIETSLGEHYPVLRRLLVGRDREPIRRLLKNQLLHETFLDLRRRHPRRALKTLCFSLLHL